MSMSARALKKRCSCVDRIHDAATNRVEALNRRVHMIMIPIYIIYTTWGCFHISKSIPGLLVLKEKDFKIFPLHKEYLG